MVAVEDRAKKKNLVQAHLRQLQEQKNMIQNAEEERVVAQEDHLAKKNQKAMIMMLKKNKMIVMILTWNKLLSA
jgi:hypothetical protein